MAADLLVVGGGPAATWAAVAAAKAGALDIPLTSASLPVHQRQHCFTEELEIGREIEEGELYPVAPSPLEVRSLSTTVSGLPMIWMLPPSARCVSP